MANNQSVERMNDGQQSRSTQQKVDRDWDDWFDGFTALTTLRISFVSALVSPALLTCPIDGSLEAPYPLVCSFRM